MTTAYIIIGIGVALLATWFFRHQRKLRLRAHLMQEAVRNRDFTFRLPTKGLLFGERAMQEALNRLGETIRQQVNQNEVESWERLTRVLTHEIMNATAPITSISQSLLGRSDVKGTPLEDGIRAICDASQHMNRLVSNYRKMSELEQPRLEPVALRQLVEDVCRAYPELSCDVDVGCDVCVKADAGMLRQTLTNLFRNAIEAGARKMALVADASIGCDDATALRRQLCLYVCNDGLPIPAEVQQSLFVPFFTTKQTGNGIGLSLSRRMMIQQGGMLDLAPRPRHGFPVEFVLTIQMA